MLADQEDREAEMRWKRGGPDGERTRADSADVKVSQMTLADYNAMARQDRS